MSNQQDFFYSIQQSATAEFKDRGSRFIAYAFPIETVDEFKTHLQILKKEHSKAVHHCFAYRLGFDKNNFRTSDDGEPSGSAGKPILNQIDSKQLTNILVIVVRYFGGTLLGVPGLINAYKTATILALQTTPIIQKAVEINYELHYSYTAMNDVMTIMKQCNCTIQQQDSQLFCTLKIGIPQNRLQEVLFKIKELINVECIKK